MSESHHSWQEKPLPWLIGALPCETTLVEANGSVSVIRVLDTFTLRLPSEAQWSLELPVLLSFRFLLLFKSGDAIGDYELRLRVETPDESIVADRTHQMTFESESHGRMFNIDISIEVELEGLYWIDVIVEEQLMTRVPFRVILTSTEDVESSE